MAVTLNGTNGLTFNDGSSQATAATGFGFKNRIINGGMVIDQRNAGASVTISTTGNTYTLDRWAVSGQATDGVYTVQQSTTAPSGFINSLAITVTTADASIGSTQFYLLTQFIEGLNVSDLGWGTASAATVTLSFWVRSSVTGTFGGAIQNNANDRSYPFSFTINSANTYEQKTITIAGDTTGTWLTTTGRGLSLRFGVIGIGSSYKTTAGAWAAGNYYAPTGSVDLIATNGATFYITGVQLEKGSTATSFDYRPYGTELQLAQRYYYRVVPDANAPFGVGWNINTTQGYINVAFPTVMRITPTAVEQNGTASNYRIREAGGGFICSSVVSFVNGSPSNSFVIFTVASGLTAGRGSFGESNSSGAYLGWSAEL